MNKLLLVINFIAFVIAFFMQRNRPNLQQRIEFPKNDIATVITLIIPLPSFSSSNGSIVVDYYY